jgi:hypothetical protein
MNRKHWQDREEHPPVDLLLLHLEGELKGRDADTVLQHVSQCAACQQSCGQLERGFSRFTAFRDSVVIPTPKPHTQDLRERLLAAQTSGAAVPLASRLQALFRLDTPPRLGFALGCASFCLIVWLTVFLTTPRQSVYASQLLSDARSASDSLLAQSKILNQKVRLRRGSLEIVRSVHHGRQAPLQALDTGIDAQFQADLDRAHINLADPLNANDFAAWRAGERVHTDTVKETAQDVTITTRISGDAITEGSLTLSRSGWRPIARSVALRGEAPIEISEVSYDISDSASMLPESSAVFSSPAVATELGARDTGAGVSTLELEIAELELREAFHSMGADVSAAPHIWRSEQIVFFRAFPENPKQMHAIENAANRIAHVKEARTQLERMPGLEPQTPPSALHTAASPLRNALERKFGSAQAADDFVDSLRNRSSRVIAEANALDELGKRYPVDAMRTFPADLQARVNSLASSLLSSLQRDSAAYLQAFSPVLDEMAKERNIVASDSETRNLPGCLHWQENAALAEPQLRNIEKDVSLLLGPSQTGKSEAPATDQVLADSLKTRAFLERHLTSTCQLFSAN